MANNLDWKDIGIGLLSMKMPSIAQGYYGAKQSQAAAQQARQQAQQLAGMSGQLYGRKADDTFQVNPVQSPSGLQMHTGGFGQQGAGLLGQEMDPERRVNIEQRRDMLASENPMMQKMALDMMAERQKQSFIAQNKAPAQFKPNMVGVGVEGSPKMRQQAYLDQQGQLQNFGPAYETGGGTNVTLKNNITSVPKLENIADIEAYKGEGNYRTKRLGNFQGEMQAGQASMDAIDETVSKLDELMAHTGITTTGFASWAGDIPAMPPNEWKNMRDTVVSRLATDKMSELKAQSASGSTGFGALSERELDLLQSQLGSLSQEQKPEAIKRQIKGIMRLLKKSKGTMQRAQDKEIGWYNRNAFGSYEPYVPGNVTIDPGMSPGDQAATINDANAQVKPPQDKYDLMSDEELLKAWKLKTGNK